ncbi:hypothetical protein GG804_04565 [Sphingomonas histidinilytica]|uniref:Uncharacterized protein n=1 Tax=Rhizorhabdus histidinilytica TaxID=439228 RepID=A0A1T5A0U7_9SPHN|nr:hypothetical protein [Rhizorhabdus histidinilytica]MBO9376029.1 hypothetical protein [Rhizorhabdus histidinilytica]SKB28283.1 hypothetical protein SAMN06295920_101418 [Rhizorhabdus histidinilytica]
MPAPAKNRQMLRFGTFLAINLVALTAPAPSIAQPAPAAAAPAQEIRGFSYSDLADLALTAQVVAGVTVVKAERLKGELAPNLAAGKARFLIEAQTGMLLRGADGLAGTISYIVDVSLDARGRAPKLKKARFILFANRVPNRPQEIRLTSPYSQLDWTQTTESALRAILTEATAPSAPPLVTGIGNAFHVPGAIPGESESQIFLTTADNRPISLSILRRPGEQPQWAVALGEMVDDSARAPARDTLLWYRLACFLPQRLPEKAVAALSAGNADAVRADYRHILDQLGPCGRTIPR